METYLKKIKTAPCYEEMCYVYISVLIGDLEPALLKPFDNM